MATRSNIGYIHGNTINYVYCHWDGYLSHNGKILLENYNHPDKVKELISFGDVSSLRPNIHPTNESHSYDNPEENVCVFYNRDRNVENVNFRTHTVSDPSDIARAVLLINEEEYAYLYDCNDNMGVWYFAKYGKFCGILTEDSVKKD